MDIEHLFDEKINSYEDVHRVVGKIIQACNLWENEFKELLFVSGIKSKATTPLGLHKINKLLFHEGILDDYEFKTIGKIIDRRNYIVHEFFSEIHNYHLEKIGEFLNGTYYVINEARDVVANKYDELKGNSTSKRPIIFDKKNDIN